MYGIWNTQTNFTKTELILFLLYSVFKSYIMILPLC